MSTRPPAVAGMFYPEKKEELATQVERYLEQAPRQTLTGNIRALISPHAGYIYSGSTAAVGYHHLSLVSQPWSSAILLGPSHSVLVEQPYGDEHANWKTPLGITPVASDLYQKLGIPLHAAAHDQEHSLETQLPFLQTVLPDVAIAPIVLNTPDPTFTESLLHQLSDEILLIVSSDLSHYLPYDKANVIDKETIRTILLPNLEKFAAVGQACGDAAVYTLLDIAIREKWRPHLLQYLNSGDTAGDKDRVVGYASVIFTS